MMTIRDISMTNTAMMSLRLSVESKQKLDKLAAATRRSRAFLAQEAINRFIESETKIVEGIMQAQQQAHKGKTVAHDEVMAKLDTLIDEIEAKKKAAV